MSPVVSRSRARLGAMAVVVAASFVTIGAEGGRAGCDRPTFRDPVANPEAAARAFRLFYRERTERAVLAYNRFAMFGDTGFATTIGNKAVAKSGTDYEVVPQPTDNNQIGTTVYSTYQAYKAMPSRLLALSLLRMFDGLAYFEAVPGVPGVSSREVLPGWTRVMDGVGHAITRTRDGAPVDPPNPASAALEAEVLATFYDGIRVTYRENPSDFVFNFKPAETLNEYAVTFSFDERPRFIRVSDCCSSFMRTPEGYPWAGAWWGNHNSRDNHPDMAIGFVTALEAMGDPSLDADVRAAAARAVEAGRRIGDLIGANGQNAMTVDEFHDYGDLTVAGARRPDGLTERETLGAMSSCPTTYAMRAVSTDGLDVPVPELPQPGEVEEFLLSELFGVDIDLPLTYCTSLNQAYFGLTFGTLFETDFFGIPLLDFITLLDILSPGIAQQIIGGFQDDYAELVQGTVAVVYHAEVTGRTNLKDAARAALA
ncbi:MAG: hypothetical protein KC466_20760, partial [Myxococcales bacterium]|nr:hypothetical protein [Myxococcales bacterium]